MGRYERTGSINNICNIFRLSHVDDRGSLRLESCLHDGILKTDDGAVSVLGGTADERRRRQNHERRSVAQHVAKDAIGCDATIERDICSTGFEDGENTDDHANAALHQETDADTRLDADRAKARSEMVRDIVELGVGDALSLVLSGDGVRLSDGVVPEGVVNGDESGRKDGAETNGGLKEWRRALHGRRRRDLLRRESEARERSV